jgi:hypothetical protein
LEKQDFPGTPEESTFDGCFFLNPGRKNVSSDTADYVKHVPGFLIFPQIPDVHRFSLEATLASGIFLRMHPCDILDAPSCRRGDNLIEDGIWRTAWR